MLDKLCNLVCLPTTLTQRFFSTFIIILSMPIIIHIIIYYAVKLFSRHSKPYFGGNGFGWTQ